MGTSQSKEEEIFITQAGNSGGQTNNPNLSSGFGSIQDILSIILIGIAVLLCIWFIYVKCKKAFEMKIRREISRSRDVV